MPGRFSGQVAVVTGGSSGLGRETCVALAREGAHLVVVGRDAARMAESAAMVRAAGPDSRVLTVAADVRREADTEAMAARALEEFGRIDILVCSAGIMRASGGALRTVAKMPVREFDDVIDINLRGVFLSNRAVLPAMIRQRGGDILNLSSKSGRIGLAFDAPYSASKFGVIGLTESLAQEVGMYGIRVQVLLPGTFDTGVWVQAGPLPRPGNLPPPSRVADMILQMLAPPRETRLVAPLVEPPAPLIDTGWRGRGGGRS